MRAEETKWPRVPGAWEIKWPGLPGASGGLIFCSFLCPAHHRESLLSPWGPLLRHRCPEHCWVCFSSSSCFLQKQFPEGRFLQPARWVVLIGCSLGLTADPLKAVVWVWPCGHLSLFFPRPRLLLHLGVREPAPGGEGPLGHPLCHHHRLQLQPRPRHRGPSIPVAGSQTKITSGGPVWRQPRRGRHSWATPVMRPPPRPPVPIAQSALGIL